jgi:hypothetical protein
MTADDCRLNVVAVALWDKRAAFGNLSSGVLQRLTSIFPLVSYPTPNVTTFFNLMDPQCIRY